MNPDTCKISTQWIHLDWWMRDHDKKVTPNWLESEDVIKIILVIISVYCIQVFRINNPFLFCIENLFFQLVILARQKFLAFEVIHVVLKNGFDATGQNIVFVLFKKQDSHKTNPRSNNFRPFYTTIGYKILFFDANIGSWFTRNCT